MASARKDFVVYGASGYTGQFVVNEVARKAAKEKSLTWAVAGRSSSKLSHALKSGEAETGLDLSAIDIIIADTNDYDSLLSMAATAKVVLNCVGPYRFHGEAVVRACVDSGTHHVDISGEPEYLEKMELKYGEKAKDAGCYVIGSCGFDSIPNDMGLVFARQQFAGKLAAVDTYLSINSKHLGLGLNTGTWNTLVHSLGNWQELGQLRKQIAKVKLPKPAHQLPKHYVTKFTDGQYYVPFMGADRSVVYRSQRDEYLANQTTPVNDNMYVKVGSIVSVLKAMLFGFVFILMTLTSFGRSLLIKYPRVFSGGMVYLDGPSKDLVAQQSFDLVLECHGYSSSEGQGRPDKRMTVKVSGPDPGYVATSTFLVESAFTILRESEKMPGSGGVMTTGYAFSETSLIERLREREIAFDVLP